MEDKNIGTLLDGRYEIQKHIGVGGMADVYKAFDEEQRRPVAVKILKNEFIHNNEFLLRFKNESKAVSMLSHTNIVKILDVGFNEDVRYIVMEYIDGMTLKDHIDQEHNLDWKETFHLVTQILRALSHAHERGIIHRDIKPQNIMMLTDGTIKVMDFGIAKFMYELGITATAQTIGSVHYLSPEQACGKITDGKSDIYSVGIMMYEMLTGKKPFDTENPVTVALMQMNDVPVFPRSINPDIPYGVEEIVLKAIEKEPAARYQTANEMIADIERFKKSPDMRFGYNSYRQTSDENIDSELEFEEPEDEYIEDDQDDEAEEVNYYIGSKKTEHNENIVSENEEEIEVMSPWVKVASFATVVAIVLVIAGLTGVINNFVKNYGDNSFSMPHLVQYDYNDMVEQYSGKLVIKIDGDPVYSEYVSNTIVSQSIEAGQMVKSGTQVFVTISSGKNIKIVPDVEGMTDEDAVNLLNDLGFGVIHKTLFNDKVPYNHVIRISPAAGTEMEVSNKVTLYISKGTQNDSKRVPNVTGMMKDEALEVLGDFTDVVIEEKDDRAPEGTVISQSVPGDTIASLSEKIKLYVSTGKPPVSTIELIVKIPEDATGLFTFKLYVNDEIYIEKENVNVDNEDQVKFEITGSEQKSVKIELLNLKTNALSLLGLYKFDFDEKTYEEESVSIHAAFEAAGGIKPAETTTTVVTTTEDVTSSTVTYSTTVTEAPHTNPVTTVPAETSPVQPPESQEPGVPPVTEVPSDTTGEFSGE